MAEQGGPRAAGYVCRDARAPRTSPLKGKERAETRLTTHGAPPESHFPV